MVQKIQQHIILLVVATLLLATTTAVAQFDIPPKPEIETSVYDYVSLLNSVQKKALEQKLINYADSTSTQIVVAIISSTKGEDIAMLGAKWGQTWGVGQKGKDNGTNTNKKMIKIKREKKT